MMLVHHQAIEAQLVREFHLVEIFVVEFGALEGVVVTVGKRHPGAASLTDGLKVHMRIGHEVKMKDLHDAALSTALNVSTSPVKAAGASSCGACPQAASTSSREPGMSLRHSSP